MITCNHGTCSVLAGGPHCTCDPGYTGFYCESCAEGYQDLDGDRVCLPTCATAQLECGAHGFCSDAGGEAICVCITGYTGEDCTDCSPGYQDRDGDGTCQGDCTTTGLDCGGHGTCTDESGLASCACATGYAGEHCELCADGYQDEDLDGTCALGCGAPGLECQPPSECVVEDGQAFCTCARGFAGPECNDCARFYTEVAGTCVWNGVPRDPTFQQPDAWLTSGGAVIETSAEGSEELGRVVFDPAARCARATVSQTFDMPAYDVGSLLQLELHTWRSDLDDVWEGGEVYLLLNGVPLASGTSSRDGAWTAHHLCLGELAHSGPLELTLITTNPGAWYGCPEPDPASVYALAVDDVYVIPDGRGACPASGTVVNGDFERLDEGWEIERLGDDTMGSVSIDPLGGAAGTAGARFSTHNVCGMFSLRGMASYPLDSNLPFAALQITHEGTPGAWLRVQTDVGSLGDLDGTGFETTSRFCLPDWTSGMARSLGFIMAGPGGSCVPTAEESIWIDDIALVSDPACEPSRLLDGGFESVALPGIESPWSRYGSIGYGTPGSAVLGSDPARAHTGVGALELKVETPCEEGGREQTIWIRQGEAAGSSLALRFWYRTENFDHAQLTAIAASTHLELAPSTAWAQAELCLQTVDWRTTHHVAFVIDGGGGSCAESFPAERAWIDDAELVSSPACR